MNWGQKPSSILDAHASKLRILRQKANIKIRKILTASFIASMIVTVGPAIDLVTAPAANAAGSGISFYFKNESGATTAITRNEFTSGCGSTTAAINFSWVGSGPSGCNTDGFTTFGTGFINPFVTSNTTYNFCVQADDGSYVTIGGSVVINNWVDQGAQTGQSCNSTGDFTFAANTSYAIKVWQHENGGGADLRLLWKKSTDSTYVIIPTENLATSESLLKPSISVASSISDYDYGNNTYNYGVGGSGGTGTLTYSLVSGTLPSILQLDTVNGAIKYNPSGTPNPGQVTTGLQVRVTDARGMWANSNAFSVTQIKATQSTDVTFTPSSIVYPNATVTVSGGNGTGAYSLEVVSAGTAGCSVSGLVITATTVGTCTVRGNRATDTNYFAKTGSTATVTFTQRAGIIVKANPINIKFGQTVTPSVTLSNFGGSDSATASSVTYRYAGINGTSYTSSTTAPTALGTYSITPSAATLTFSTGSAGGYSSTTYQSDTLTISATVPGAPTSVVATGTSGVSASISFTAPASNGGTSITSYRVYNTTDNVVATGTSSPITVTGLTVGSTYTFKINAITAQGYSDTATASAITVNRTNLSAPSSITATAPAGAAKSILVSWSAASNAQGYAINIKSGGSTVATIYVSSGTTSKSITTSDYSSLADGTTYTFEVIALGDATQWETSTAISTTGTTNATGLGITFGTATRKSGGFTVPISNYDASFTYDTITATSGTATFVTGGFISVTGLPLGGSASITISTRKSGFITTTGSGGPFFALETPTALSLNAKSLTAGRPYKILYSADASNPNKPTYTSSTPSYCTVSGETITPLAYGTCTITGTLAGYSTFDTATVTSSFNVYFALSNPGFSFFNRSYISAQDSYTWQTNGGVGPYTVTLVSKTTGLAIPGIEIQATYDVTSNIHQTPITIAQYTSAMNDTVTITVTDANGAVLVYDTKLVIYKATPVFTVTPSETLTSVSNPISFTVTTSSYNVTGSMTLQYTNVGTRTNMAGCTNIPLVNGGMTCTWTNALVSNSSIYANYSGDSNYYSGAETTLASSPTIKVNNYVYANYPQLTVNYGVGGTQLPISVNYGTGSKSEWTWEIVRTSDSSTVSGITMDIETITVASTVAVGTYNMMVRVTDSKGVTAHLPAVVVVSKGNVTMTLAIDSTSVTVGKSTTIRFTASLPGVTGTVKLFQGSTTTVVQGCDSVTLVNSEGTCLATSLSAYGPTIIYYQYFGDSNFNARVSISSLQSIQFFPRTSLSYSSTSTNYGTAANFVGTYTTRGGGAANTWVWSIVKTSDSATVSGITISGETITVSNTVPAGTYAMTITTIDGLGDTTYKSVTITVNQLTGLTPTFGAVTRTANGYTTTISNYSADYNFQLTISAGSVETGTASGSSLPITVTGLSDSQSATITVTTSRLNYTSPSATVSGASLGAGLTPIFGTPTKIAGGFTVSISNYSASYTWTESVTAGTVTAGTPSGSNRTYTISGLTPGQSATLSVSDTSTTTKLVTSTVSGVSLASQAAVTLTKTSGTYPGETLTATGGTGTGALTYSLSGPSTVSVSGTQIAKSALSGSYSIYSPDGSTLYTLSSGSPTSTLSRFDIASSTFLSNYLVPASSNQFAMAPDGSYVLVVSTTSVTKVTLSTGETTTLVSSGITYATGISIDPTGTGDFYVSDTNANRIRGYFANGSVKFSTYVQWNAYGDLSSMMRSAIKPDGTRLYVVGSASDGTLYEFNTSTGAKTRESSLSRSTAGLNNVVVTPDGLYAFVTHSSSGYIYRVDLTAWTSSSLRPSASSTNLNFVSVSPDSSFVITSSSSQEIPNYFYRQISVSAFTVMASFGSTFATPASSAIAPDGKTGYLIDTGGIRKITFAWGAGSAKCSINGTRISAQAAGTCLVVATKAADADYLTESSTATTFTFNAASALRIAAVAGTVYYKPTAQYSPRSTFSGFVGSDTGTVSSLTYSYAGINGTSYGPSATVPTSVGTYSVTPSVGTISMSSGYIAGYASPNSYVSDTLTVQATVPDSVTAVSVTVNSSTSATVSFTAPVNTGGAAITSYVISSTTDTVTASASTSPVTITGLSPGTAYAFRVNAINSVGRSETATATQVYTKLGVTLSSTSITGYFGTPIETITPTVRGGSGITYSVSPTLPTGLSISLAGVISGTPTETKTATTYTETATYSSYTTGTATFTLTILKGDSSITTPTISPSSPILGQALTFTSTVTSVNSRATLTGTISFKNALGTLLCETTTITLGAASCSYTPLTTDTFTVRAFYSGMTYIDSSTSTALTVVPTKANPSITAATTTPFIRTVDTATIRATIVTGTATNATGNVSFTIGDSAISGCSSRSVTSNVATCVFTPTSTGVYSIVATYAGDLNYNGAAASSTSVTVSLCTQSISGTITANTGAPAAGYCAVSITAASSGSLGLPVGITSMKARVLVIGGGGAGGTRHGGGGGAGSLLYSAAYDITDTRTVTIGAGGVGDNSGPNATNDGTISDNNGRATSFGSVIAAGGGAGGGNTVGPGFTGGSSGGGAGSSTGADPTQTSFSGFDSYVNKGAAGTSGTVEPQWSGGGGGGAGGNGIAGISGNPATPGVGGAGRVYDMTLDGSYGCFAAGGGGGRSSSLSSAAPAGAGGSCTGLSTAKVGGDGALWTGSTAALSGVDNTGSGGGGGGFVGGSNYTTGSGGSGLVALRYISAPTITVPVDTSTASLANVSLVAVVPVFANLFTRTYQWQKYVGSSWRNETSTSASTLTLTFIAHYGEGTTQKYRLLVTDSDGTLSTTTASRTITLTVTPLTQPTLTVATTFAVAGSSFPLSTAGGGGLGTVSYASVASGSTAGCSLVGSTLTLATAGICKVVATKAADIDYLIARSETTTVSFVVFQIAPQVAPTNTNTGISTPVGTTTTKGADACTSGCVPRITNSNVYEGRAGDLVVLTGINLSTVRKVYFNIYTEAPTFTADSATQISVRIPAGLPTGDATIEVISPGGTSARYFDFTILP